MDETNMMHGQHYAGQDVSNWVATEKLDGIRAYWDGRDMWSRGGKRIIPPSWFALPADIELDGELFAGYGNRQLAINAARYGRWDVNVRFVAFDAPKVNGNYAERLEVANGHNNHRANGLGLRRFNVQSSGHAIKYAAQIKSMGGEGIIVRHPELVYMPGRTDLMLKIK